MIKKGKNLKIKFKKKVESLKFNTRRQFFIIIIHKRIMTRISIIRPIIAFKSTQLYKSIFLKHFMAIHISALI